MATILLDIDNTDKDNPIFVGKAAGADAAAVEAKMAETIKRYVEKSKKADEFTVVRSTQVPKGYVLILTLKSVKVDAGMTKCVISGLIVQYPRERNAKGEIGDVAVSLSLQASGGVSGSKTALLDCVDALVEDIMGKAIPEMRRHFATRR